MEEYSAQPSGCTFVQLVMDIFCCSLSSDKLLCVCSHLSCYIWLGLCKATKCFCVFCKTTKCFNIFCKPRSGFGLTKRAQLMLDLVIDIKNNRAPGK